MDQNNLRYKKYSNYNTSPHRGDMNDDKPNTQIIKRMTDHQQIFPNTFVQILQHETKNLQCFKLKLNRQKQKINEDIGIVKNEIFNTLDDLRLSLHAHLDKIYQKYMQKYADFKNDLQEVVLMKDKLQIQSNFHLQNYKNVSKRYNKHFGQSFRQNNVTISQMQDHNNSHQKSIMLSQINQVQKERVQILAHQEKQILTLTQYDNGFYQSDKFCTILSNMKKRLNHDIAQIYQKGISLSIIQISSLIGNENYRILDALNINTIKKSRADVVVTLPKHTQTSHKRSPIFGRVSSSMQSVRVDWIQNAKIQQVKKIILKDYLPLCGTVICNQMVFGCRDGSIVIKSIEGLHINSNKAHKASICCLAVVKIKGQLFLLSGSDHGCNSVIVWEPTTWKPIDRYDEHTAAISAIIDLQDECHVVSTGYDKKINIYDLERGKLKFSLGSSQSPIVNATINKSATRLVVANLDKFLSVWHIVRNNTKVQSMFLEKKIAIQSLTCSMNSSILLNQHIFIGTKDGKIKLINIEKGQIQQSLKCSSNYITEMLLIERQSKQRNYAITQFRLQFQYGSSKKGSFGQLTVRLEKQQTTNGLVMYNFVVELGLKHFSQTTAVYSDQLAIVQRFPKLVFAGFRNYVIDGCVQIYDWWQLDIRQQL